jgi:hypothetical protein
LKKIDEYNAAKYNLDQLGDELDHFLSIGFAHPWDKLVAAQSLNANYKSLSTQVGRRLGERGVFTEGDRKVYSETLSPGVTISELDPAEAKRRIYRLQVLMNKINTKDLENFKKVNPNSAIPDVQNPPQLPPPPGYSSLPPPAERVKGQEYRMSDGKMGIWLGPGQGFRRVQ